MNKIQLYIKEKYNLSNYQIAQLTFVFNNTFSELSKIIIMGILFHDHLSLFVFLLLQMCSLRVFSGGLHFYTYAKCLLASILYIGVIIVILSRIILPLWLRLFLSIICMILCYITGPILSKYRNFFPTKQLYFCRNITCLIIFTYSLIMYIIPDNHYLNTGVWMIILHSLQLLVAKIQKKGETKQ